MGSEILDQHVEICEELQQILNEENRWLRKKGGPVDDSILNQKRRLLPRLEESLHNLKKLQEETPEIIPALKEKLNAAQNKIMKILLLDRENEQLLLKSIVPNQGIKPQLKSMQTVKSIYDKHRIPQG
jgi:flagellar biosynthesis/type III secretory pathway chaperone